MNPLTEFQTKLINDLTEEFARLNPIVSENKGKRFSVETIEKSLNQKENFKISIKEFNKRISKSYTPIFLSEIDMVKKEFEKYLDIKIGVMYSNTKINNNVETFFGDDCEYFHECTHPSARELYIFFTKKGSFNGDSALLSNYVVNEERRYVRIYCSFKFEKIGVVLECGEQIILNKIRGLKFSERDWLVKDEHKKSYSSLYELLNNSVDLQTKITNLCK